MVLREFHQLARICGIHVRIRIRAGAATRKAGGADLRLAMVGRRTVLLSGICVHLCPSVVEQCLVWFVNFAPFRGDLFRGFIREIRAIRGEI